MIFTVLVDESDKAIVSMEKFKETIQSIINLDFTPKSVKSLQAGLANTLNSDIKVLGNYSDAIKSGITDVNELNKILAEGSAAVLDVRDKYNKSAQGIDKSIKSWTIAQREQNSAQVESARVTAINTMQQKALAVALNIGLMLAITAVVQGIHYLITAQERAIEKAEQLTGEYKNLQSELESLQSELKTTAERIDELNNKDHLTLTEQAELEKLKVANEQLKTQIELTEKLAKASKENAQKATIKVLEQQSERSHGENARYAGTNVRTDRFTAVDERMRELDALKATEKELQNQLKALDTNSRYWDIVNAKLTANQTEQQKVKSYILETTDELLKQKDGLDATTEAGSEWIKKIDGLAVAVNQFFNEDFTGKFNEIYNADEFDSVREKIETLAQAGQLTADVFTSQFPALSQALQEVGISADEAVSHINAMNSSNVEQANQSFGDLSKSAEKAKESTSTLLSSLNMASEAFKEQAENGSLCVDTQLALADAGYASALAFDEETGAAYLNRDAFIELVKIKIQNQINDLQMLQIDLANKLIQEGQAAIDSAAGINANSSAKAQNVVITEELANAQSRLNEALAGGIVDTSNTDYQAYQELEVRINALKNAFENVGNIAAGTYSTGMQKAKDSSKEFLDALKELQTAVQGILDLTMKMLKQKYSDAKDELQELAKIADKVRDDAKKAEDESHKQDKKAIDKRKKDLQSLSKEKKKIYDADKKAEKESFDLIKKRYEYEKQALKDILDSYKAQIQLQIDALDQEEESYDYQKQLEEKVKSITDIQKKLDSIQFATDEKSNRQRREWLEDLSNAQNDLNEFQYKNSLQLQKDALNQALDEFEATQEKKLSDLEIQFNLEQEQFETRLSNMESEHEAWQEYYDSEMESLDAKSERLQEDHEAELERIEAAYNSEKDKLDKQIKDIDDYTKKDINIKLEAQKLINEKSDQFYKDLTQYAHEYTDMTNDEFQKLWNDSYTAMSTYNSGQIDVGKTLEILAQRMDNFASNVSSAASAMERLADASKRVKTPSTSSGTFDAGGSGGYSKYHDGGIAGESSSQKHNGRLKSNEIIAVLEKGEPILSNKKSSSDIQNALSYLEDALPKNDTRAMLAAFVNSSTDLQSLIHSPTSINSSALANNLLSRNIGISPTVSNLERIDNIGDVKFETNLHVAGNLDKSVLPEIKQMIKSSQDETIKKMYDNMMNHRKRYGAPINYAKR